MVNNSVPRLKVIKKSSCVIMRSSDTNTNGPETINETTINHYQDSFHKTFMEKLEGSRGDAVLLLSQ